MPTENEKQVPVTLTQPTTPPKRAFYKKPKFIFAVIGLIILIGLVLWLARVFTVYNRASEYKKAYNVMETELTYCESIRNQKEAQNVFNYCDILTEKFKDIKRGQ